MKQLLLIFLLIPGLLTAQEIDRVTVNGVISASKSGDVEGITVYNTSSAQGTITDFDGNFTLVVGVNDHILISALQFQDFTIIVTEKEVAQRTMSVYLNPNINRLDEVLVRSTDLTGNLEEDVKRIKTSVFNPDWDLSYAALEFGYGFERDQYSKVEGNAAEEALGMNNIPVASVDIIKLVELFFPKKRRSKGQIRLDKYEITNELWKKYDIEYLSVTFDIPQDKVNEFVYFIEDQGFSNSLLHPDNEIKLIAYLFDQSEKYKLLLAKKD